MEYGKLIFLKCAKISFKTKNSTISHKIYFSTHGVERNCKKKYLEFLLLKRITNICKTYEKYSEKNVKVNAVEEMLMPNV